MTAPTIVTREQAALLPPTAPYTPWRIGQPSGKTGHWEGAGGHTDHGQCAAEWRAIQLYHLHTGYIDIAYHWGVCQHGVIFTGRPVHSVESAAQRDGNHYRVAIVFIGGPLTPFTAAARAAYAWLLRSYGGENLSHRDEPSCDTTCAGNEITLFIHTPSSWPTIVLPPQPAPAPKPLPPEGIHHPTLHIGSPPGPATMELQRKLNGVTNAGLKTDAVFGDKTKHAVENFQRFFHDQLTVDGIAGPKTWGLLDYIAMLKHVW